MCRFVEKRRAGLAKYMQQLLRQPMVWTVDAVLEFLDNRNATLATTVNRNRLLARTVRGACLC